MLREDPKGRDRLIRVAWYFYDFANSSYSAVIAATIFPVYYVKEIVGNGSNLGDFLWGEAISLSMALTALFSPYMGATADFMRTRKALLMILTSICVLSVGSFSLLKRGMAFEGFLLILIANFSMESAFVFYNSYLPDIEKGCGLGRTSALGFAMGYLGSILSLLLSLFLLRAGLVNLIWPFCAFFFLIFSVPLFLLLPSESRIGSDLSMSLKKGLYDTVTLLKGILRERNMRYFIIGYLLYEDGLATVIVFSSVFATSTLGFSYEDVLIFYISVQTSAMLGSFFISRFVERIGYLKTLEISLLAWTFVTFSAALCQEKWQFVPIGLAGGLFLGMVQASSRALFATFIPRGEEAKYFGVYSLVGKSSGIMGPGLFGLMSYTTGSQRLAVLLVSLFFLWGLLSVRRIKI